MNEEKQAGLPLFGIPRLFPYLKPYRVKIICMILLGAISSGMDAAYPLFNRYALNHFNSIRYIKWHGGCWKVTGIDASTYPRLKLTIGGVYNGPTLAS